MEVNKIFLKKTTKFSCVHVFYKFIKYFGNDTQIVQFQTRTIP